MAQMRGWKAAPGATRTVYVVGGRRLWRVDVHFIGIETIGSRSATAAPSTSPAPPIVRDPTSGSSAKASRTFEVWLSDDGDRVPLKMVAQTELGPVTMELTEYNRP